ncbi:CBS domain-containing protein [Oceanobacter mangrovi]|uniref:CBS domain-containing protein n=1 Tax=Oceanobacter mangrovi TaxID=2862510 RepID=UPI001C8D5D85|nr:CBS domain-containing protein [Oceanobacter mangrovi]
MHKLKLHSVSAIDELARPSHTVHISLASPAEAFFTDFNKTEPLVIDAIVPAIEARKMMIRTHVRLKLVVDELGQFVGVISAEQLSDQQILQEAASTHGTRNDVLVADLMLRKKDLAAFDISEVEKSTIGDVVNFLRDVHQQHCLVLDSENHKIRGIFSASDISRKLRLPLDIQEQSSFARVFGAVS